MKHAIPDAALDDRLAFVGTSGSGKTYAAGTAVERLLKRKARVVIPDPLGVWWGVRLKADGSPSPYNVMIFGGARGDLPLTERSGAVIGEAAATMAESCILDLSGLDTKAAERRFMLAFLERLYRSATGEPFHLVFDEADLWAPQRSSEPQLQSLMENIVRRGRIKGFIPWLITQRPAVLSKDVLSQADGLVAMKLTSSQDRDAIGAWIEGQADRKDEKRMLARLPQLERGHGVVWIPGRGVLSEVAFPAKETFDSSRTPKRGETVRQASLKPIDLEAVKVRLAAIEAEVSKPKLLARVAAAAAPASSAQPVVAQPDPRALQAARDEGRTIGFDDGRRVGYAEGFREAQKAAAAAVGAVKAPEPSLAAIPSRAPTLSTRPTVAAAVPARHAVAAPASGEVAKLSRAERLILSVLAQYPLGRTKVQVAILTGYAVNGGGFNNALGALRSKGCITSAGDHLMIDEPGWAYGPFDPLPEGDALRAYWMGQLAKAERAILEVLTAAYPSSLGKEEVAQAAGYEAKGGGFNNALGKLRTLELISGKTDLRASDALFDMARVA